MKDRDRDELLRWLSAIQQPPRRAFVTHGEPSSASAFADAVRAKLHWNVSVPAYREEADLT